MRNPSKRIVKVAYRKCFCDSSYIMATRNFHWFSVNWLLVTLAGLWF